MSEKAARIHTHSSNRARKDDVGQRRTVFKSVLDTPFRIQWPSVPVNLKNAILSLVVSMVQDVAEYQQHRRQGKRKRKPDDEPPPGSNKRRKDDETSTARMVLDEAPPSTDSSSNTMTSSPPEISVEPPQVLQHITVGINQVTKRLELQTRRRRAVVLTIDPEVGPPRAPLGLILVCREDVNPSILVDHIPHLVAAHNSAQSKEPVKLVPLPKGAEASISTAVGLRRAAVIGLDAGSPGFEALVPLLSSVPTLSASWLTPAASRQEYIPTHIKQLKTSAPNDMKAAKERRREKKALVKKAKKRKIQLSRTTDK